MLTFEPHIGYANHFAFLSFLIHLRLQVVLSDHFEKVAPVRPSGGPIVITLVYGHVPGHFHDRCFTLPLQVHAGHVSAFNRIHDMLTLTLGTPCLNCVTHASHADSLAPVSLGEKSVTQHDSPFNQPFSVSMPLLFVQGDLELHNGFSCQRLKHNSIDKSPGADALDLLTHFPQH